MKEEEIISETDENFYTPNPAPSSMSDNCLQDESDFADPWHEEYGTRQETSDITSTWGDFESFTESTPQSEIFCYSAEEMSGALQDISSATTSHSTKTFKDVDSAVASEFHVGWEHLLLEEDPKAFQSLFRDSFPDIPVDQCNEDVESLQQLIVSSNKACTDDDLIQTKPWPTFFSWERFREMSASEPACEWMKSESCTNLLTLLGVDASNKSSRDNLICNDSETPNGNRTMQPAGNKALIQTKLHVAPDSKDGQLFSYHLFLKKSPADLTLPFLTFYGKKSFFNTNHLRLDF